MQTVTKEEILKKIHHILHNSSMLNSSMYSQFAKLDIDQLKRAYVLLFNIYYREKQMSGTDIDISRVNYSQAKNQLRNEYQKILIKGIKYIEKRQQSNDFEELFNNI